MEILELNKTKGAQIRSKIKYIEEAETNSKYFLGVEKTRGDKKAIIELNAGDGTTVKNPINIINLIKEYYTDLFSLDRTVDGSLSSLNSFLDNTNFPILNATDREFCEKTVTTEELTIALKSLNSDSVAGYDGLPVSFYKMFWSRLRQPLSECLSVAIDIGELTISQKRGSITLLHKGKDRQVLTNWSMEAPSNVKQ